MCLDCGQAAPHRPSTVDPYEFYLGCLSEIAATDPQNLVQGSSGGEWSRSAIVYNLFPRLTTAFDHNGDGESALDQVPTLARNRNAAQVHRAPALYPQYGLQHSSPAADNGSGQEEKRTLGSPYSIRNPYQLDGNLDEPALDLNVDHLFAAFVDAAHLLGIRVILEFVLRTGAKDSDWIPEHPDWFYWNQSRRTRSGTPWHNRSAEHFRKPDFFV